MYRSSTRAGGGNVPAMNELLEPFGVAFGDMVLEGQLEELGGDRPWYASGSNIVKWPGAGWLHAAVLADKASEGGSNTTASASARFGFVSPAPVASFFGGAMLLGPSTQITRSTA